MKKILLSLILLSIINLSIQASDVGEKDVGKYVAPKLEIGELIDQSVKNNEQCIEVIMRIIKFAGDTYEEVMKQTEGQPYRIKEGPRVTRSLPGSALYRVQHSLNGLKEIKDLGERLEKARKKD